MPPASLSTFAVMKPGPMTASTRTIRAFQLLSRDFIGWALVRVPQHRDHVVCRDDAGQASVFVDDAERHEVVFVEEPGDLVVGRVGAQVTVSSRSSASGVDGGDTAIFTSGTAPVIL